MGQFLDAGDGHLDVGSRAGGFESDPAGIGPFGKLHHRLGRFGKGPADNRSLFLFPARSDHLTLEHGGHLFNAGRPQVNELGGRRGRAIDIDPVVCIRGGVGGNRDISEGDAWKSAGRKARAGNQNNEPDADKTNESRTHVSRILSPTDFDAI